MRTLVAVDVVYRQREALQRQFGGLTAEGKPRNAGVTVEKEPQ